MGGWYVLGLSNDGTIKARVTGAGTGQDHPFQEAPGSNGRVAIEGYEWVGAKEGEYTLRLTKQEGIALQDLLQSVGGSPSMSRRRYTDAVLKKLSEALDRLPGFVKDTKGFHHVA